MVSKLLIIAVAAVVIIALVVVSLYLYISSVTRALVSKITSQVPPVRGVISGSAIIKKSGIVSYDNSYDLAEYAILDYNYVNVTHADFVLSVYNSMPVKRIYLLNTGLNQCFDCIGSNPNYVANLYSNLTNYFQTYGLIFNSSSFTMINITNLPKLPGNSLIIVPTGLMPSCLLPLSGSCTYSNIPTIIQLLARSDTIVYTGRNFSSYIDQSGDEVLSSQATLSALNNAGITSKGSTAGSTEWNGLAFDTPQWSFVNYSVGTSGMFGSSFYGPVTYVSAENGSIVAFSNYPSSSWRNTSQMAHDITLALSSRFWIKLLSQSAVTNATNVTTGLLPIFTTNAPIRNAGVGNRSINQVLNNSYSLVSITLFNTSGFFIKDIPFRQRFENNGTLGMPDIIGQNEEVSLLINLTSQNGKKGQQSNTYHIDIYNDTYSFIYGLYVGELNTSHAVIVPMQFSFKPGYYIASLRDISNRSYEDALFYMPPLNVTPTVINFADGIFVLKVRNYNETASGVPFTASLNNEYVENGTILKGILNYTLPRKSIISYGPQILRFSILQSNYSFSYNYAKPATTGIPSIYIEFGIAGLAILILNLVARAPIRDDYYIDVPEFPPTEKVEMKADSASLINVFNSVNEKFGWRHMPLTSEEVKAGIGTNIRYKNVPIMITIENTDEILYGLANSGKVEIMPPYAMPKAWEAESRHSMEYLVVFRRLRDFAVKNAMLFTELDTAEKGDMIVTNRGKQSRIYIYSRSEGMKAIELDGTKTFVVFSSELEKAAFLDKLYITYGAGAERLKIALESNAFSLIDADNLEQLLY